MLDVIIPTTDGRKVRMQRYPKPGKAHQSLLGKLGFTLPTQPPPQIKNPMPVVETFSLLEAKINDMREFSPQTAEVGIE